MIKEIINGVKDYTAETVQYFEEVAQAMEEGLDKVQTAQNDEYRNDEDEYVKGSNKIDGSLSTLRLAIDFQSILAKGYADIDQKVADEKEDPYKACDRVGEIVPPDTDQSIISLLTLHCFRSAEIKTLKSIMYGQTDWQ